MDMQMENEERGAEPPVPSVPTVDPTILEKWLTVSRFFCKVFRVEFENVDKLPSDRPVVLTINHNSGMWGILDVLFCYVLWWDKQDAPSGLLAAYGEDTVFGLPGLGQAFRKVGGVGARIDSLRKNLRDGHSAIFAPGANADNLKSVWLRDRPRFRRVVRIDGRVVFPHNVGYLKAALDAGAWIVPVSISGTAEITPILAESQRLLRWTGLDKLRADENWPGFPVTLNHLLNLLAFMCTPLCLLPPAWVAFALANIYVDLFYFYPVFPVKVWVRVLDPIDVRDHVDESNLRRSYDDLCTLNAALEKKIADAHEAQDAGRRWLKVARPLFDFMARRSSNGEAREAGTKGAV